MAFQDTIDDLASLRERYGVPTRNTLAKVIDRLDEGARQFIAASPFAVLATSSADGTDASPRGGPPGFAAILDDHHLALGDLSGNRILDSFRNVLENPAVGLIFFIPGMDETLRVNGRAVLTRDPEVLEACRIDGRLPAVALGIEVDQCYVHCAKAFRRSALWQPDTWLAAGERPSAACLLRDHIGLEVEPSAIDATLEAGYAATMWDPGGQSA
jgi:uncharacterized protein